MKKRSALSKRLLISVLAFQLFGGPAGSTPPPAGNVRPLVVARSSEAGSRTTAKLSLFNPKRFDELRTRTFDIYGEVLGAMRNPGAFKAITEIMIRSGFPQLKEAAMTHPLFRSSIADSNGNRHYFPENIENRRALAALFRSVIPRNLNPLNRADWTGGALGSLQINLMIVTSYLEILQKTKVLPNAKANMDVELMDPKFLARFVETGPLKLKMEVLKILVRTVDIADETSKNQIAEYESAKQQVIAKIRADQAAGTVKTAPGGSKKNRGAPKTPTPRKMSEEEIAAEAEKQVGERPQPPSLYSIWSQATRFHQDPREIMMLFNLRISDPEAFAKIKGARKTLDPKKVNKIAQRLMDLMDEDYDGQTALKQALIGQFLAHAYGLRVDGRAPYIGLHFMSGPTGTGKTYLIEVFYSALKKLEDPKFVMKEDPKILRANGGEYTNSHDVSKIKGSSLGIEGSQGSAAVFSPTNVAHNTIEVSLPDIYGSGKPVQVKFNIVLVDEVEKAHKSVGQLLLSPLDGTPMNVIADNQSHPFSFRDSIVFLSSNSIQDRLTELAPQLRRMKEGQMVKVMMNGKEVEKVWTEADIEEYVNFLSAESLETYSRQLESGMKEKVFSREFRGRLSGSTWGFQDLTENDFLARAKTKIRKLQVDFLKRSGNENKEGIVFVVEDGVRDLMIASIDKSEGTRAINNMIRKHILEKIEAMRLNGELENGQTLFVKLPPSGSRNKYEFRFEKVDKIFHLAEHQRVIEAAYGDVTPWSKKEAPKVAVPVSVPPAAVTATPPGKVRQLWNYWFSGSGPSK